MEDKKKGFPNLLSRPKAERPNDTEDPIPPENPTVSVVEEYDSETIDDRPAPLMTSSTMSDDGVEKSYSSDLSEQDKKEIYDAIDLIRRKLSFTKDFTEEEREDLIRLGKTGRRFVEKAAGLVERSPGILPRSFNVEEFHRDAELYQELGDISDELKKLSEQVGDTEAAVGSDAFSAALVVYQSGKLARTGDDMDNLLSGWRRKLEFD